MCNFFSSASKVMSFISWTFKFLSLPPLNIMIESFSSSCEDIPFESKWIKIRNVALESLQIPRECQIDIQWIRKPEQEILNLPRLKVSRRHGNVKHDGVIKWALSPAMWDSAIRLVLFLSEASICPDGQNSSQKARPMPFLHDSFELYRQFVLNRQIDRVGRHSRCHIP
jgi:hypothetical protein